MLFGSVDTPFPERKSLQPAAPSARAMTATVVHVCLMASSCSCSRPASAVEGEGEDERPGLRVVEVVDAPDRRRRSEERRLRIDPAVVGPGLQVPPRDAEIHAAESQEPVDPGGIER